MEQRAHRRFSEKWFPAFAKSINWRGAAAATVGIMLCAALAELAMGRLLICKCGYVLPWYGYIKGPGNSQHLADWYTFSHLVHGVLFYGLLKVTARRLPPASRFVLAVLIESTWECFENTPFAINRYRHATIALDYVGDSVINSMMDILFCAAGFLAAWRFPVWLSITFVLVAELAVGYLVRDNLTLNIIMFIYPLQFIKTWQSGLTPIPSAP